jgi:hypothetical protein
VFDSQQRKVQTGSKRQCRKNPSLQLTPELGDSEVSGRVKDRQPEELTERCPRHAHRQCAGNVEANPSRQSVTAERESAADAKDRGREHGIQQPIDAVEKNPAPVRPLVAEPALHVAIEC